MHDTIQIFIVSAKDCDACKQCKDAAFLASYSVKLNLGVDVAIEVGDIDDPKTIDRVLEAGITSLPSLCITCFNVTKVLPGDGVSAQDIYSEVVHLCQTNPTTIPQ